jgi:hypothetical protein
MPTARPVSGDVVQAEVPRWEPLLAAVGEGLADWFMWMSELRLSDGTRVDVYKHVSTRRYLHLADDGAAFRLCAPGGYRPSDVCAEIAGAFVGWEIGNPARESIAALDALLGDERRAA